MPLSELNAGWGRLMLQGAASELKVTSCVLIRPTPPDPSKETHSNGHIIATWLGTNHQRDQNEDIWGKGRQGSSHWKSDGNAFCKLNGSKGQWVQNGSEAATVAGAVRLRFSTFPLSLPDINTQRRYTSLTSSVWKASRISFKVDGFLIVIEWKTLAGWMGSFLYHISVAHTHHPHSHIWQESLRSDVTHRLWQSKATFFFPYSLLWRPLGSFQTTLMYLFFFFYKKGFPVLNTDSCDGAFSYISSVNVCVF